jgi:hypothetical protein
MTGDDKKYICPGCGVDEGDLPSLYDHMGDCDFPNEERLTVEIEFRKLKDPDGFENYSEVPEHSFSLIANGDAYPCTLVHGKLGDIKVKVGRVGVYYVRAPHFLFSFLKAIGE